MKGKRVAGAATVAVLAAAAVAVGSAVVSEPRAATSTAQVPTGSAPVTRGTVTERVLIQGILGFDGSYQIVNKSAPGTLTEAPPPGAVVRRGGVLYKVDNHPVRLLYGAVPAYRAFASGMTNGPDVRQLEENLVALGQDPDHRITVDSRFTAATARSIRRWQASWGLPARERTGALPAGEVLFQPGALRVGQAQAAVGTAVGPGALVFAATSTDRVVTAQITTDRQGMVHVNDKVQISLGDGTPVEGTVVRIGRVASAPSQQDGGDQGPLTLPVTIKAIMPAGSADLDQAPVQVAIATSIRQDVLRVPVTALLARPGGGYQVRLASGGYVEVRPGLFDESAGLVEVTGGLAAGDRVEVPTS
jgi:peptidoglycan hydrolase-like protein with peptidoglycan-binding domain